MRYEPNATQRRITSLTQELLREEATISPEIIAQKVEVVIGLQPAWGSVDRGPIVSELIRRNPPSAAVPSGQVFPGGLAELAAEQLANPHGRPPVTAPNPAEGGTGL